MPDLGSGGGTVPSAAERLLAQANLPLDRCAALIALGEGLARIGRLRTGREAGQFSIHNFLLRAVREPSARAPGETALVVLMRAGVFRRRLWYLRACGDATGLQRLELPAPIPAGWQWWPAIDEIRGRLVGQAVWRQAGCAPFPDALAAVRSQLLAAQVVRLGKS